MHKQFGSVADGGRAVADPAAVTGGETERLQAFFRRAGDEIRAWIDEQSSGQGKKPAEPKK
jgi:hypothetical protein